MLGDALLDLTRLLVRVHVQRQVVLGRVRAEFLEPVARAGAHGVRRHADADAGAAQLLESAQVLGDRRLAEARDPAPRVCGVEHDDLDAGVACGLGRIAGLGRPEVVELADGGVAGGAQLAVDACVQRAHLVARMLPRRRA